MTSIPQEPTCPRCGRWKSEWRTAHGMGFSQGGATYCCEGCATGKQCACELRQEAPRLERNVDPTPADSQVSVSPEQMNRQLEADTGSSGRR